MPNPFHIRENKREKTRVILRWQAVVLVVLNLSASLQLCVCQWDSHAPRAGPFSVPCRVCGKFLRLEMFIRVLEHLGLLFIAFLRIAQGVFFHYFHGRTSLTTVLLTILATGYRINNKINVNLKDKQRNKSHGCVTV